MKKQLVAAMCAAGLVMASAPAQGVEFKPYGIMEFVSQWDGNIDIGNAFQNSADVFWNKGGDSGNSAAAFHQKTFRPIQRLIMGINISASENLSLTYDMIAGFNTWGGPSSGISPDTPQAAGGALGTRAANIISRNAYMDWTIPNTKIKIRMGMQNFYLPGFATGTLPIKVEFGTGIVVNAPVTENISATAIWMRATSGPRRGSHSQFLSTDYQDDTSDFFALTVPVKGNGYRWAPNFGVGIVGKDSFTTKTTWLGARNASFMSQGMRRGQVSTSDLSLQPVTAAAIAANMVNGTKYTPGTLIPYWIGIGGELTMWDPLRLAIDIAYGATKADHEMYRRSGWYAGIMASYKTQYGVPTLKAWYTTGDDDNIQNGSERPAAWSGGGANTGLLNASGLYNITTGYEAGSLMGTWGFSLQWNNLSLYKDLFHSLRIAYFQGTNSAAMAPYARSGMNYGSVMLGANNRPAFSVTAPGNLANTLNYMTTKDSLIEIDFENIYSIYKNLAAMVEVNYIILNYDSKTWGANLNDGKGFRKAKFSNPWRVAMSLRYTF